MSELESKQDLPRSEIAAYLREFADELDTGGSLADTAVRATTGEKRSPNDPIGTDDPDVDESVRANEMETSDPDTADDRVTDDALQQQQSRSPEDRVTIVVGDESATVNPPVTPTFEIEVNSDTSIVGSGRQESVAFELEWEVDEDDGHGDIEIK